MYRKKLISLSISVLFTVILCYILLQFVSLDNLVYVIKKIPIGTVLFAFVFHFATYIFRSLIISIFLRDTPVSFKNIFVAHLIQNLFVHVIPAGLGEFSFPFLLKKWVPMTRSLSSVILTKLLLLAGMMVLFFFSLFFIEMHHINIDNTGIWGLIMLVLIVFTILLIFQNKKITRLLKKIKLGKSSIYSNIKHFKDSIIVDLVKLKKWRVLTIVLVLVFLSNVSLASFYFIILNSLEIHLSIWDCLFISSIGLAFLVLPIKSVGGFGTSEGVWAIGMIILGYSEKVGIESGFVVHIIALFNVVVLFIVGMLLRGFSQLMQSNIVND